MTDPAAAPAVDDAKRAEEIVAWFFIGRWVAQAPRPSAEERDALIVRVTAALADARRAERAECADWFEETFCPRSGVPGDEQHARGDCDYCNMAAAIRRPGGAPDEGAKG